MKTMMQTWKVAPVVWFQEMEVEDGLLVPLKILLLRETLDRKRTICEEI